MNNFPRYKELRLKDVYLDIVGRFLGVFTLAFPFIWFYGLNAIGSGNKIFAIISALILTVMETFSFCFIMKGLYKLIHHYTKYTGVLRILICLFALYIPYLEIRYLIKDKYTDIIIVPAFIQKIKGINIIFCSFITFVDGIPELNAIQFSEEIKNFGFFSTANSEYDAVSIATNTGEFLCMLDKIGKIYMFRELGQNERYILPTENCDWKIEISFDDNTSAVLLEFSYDPFFETEKTLALDIVNALTELEKYHQTI